MAEPSITIPGEGLEYLEDDPRYAKLSKRVHFINRYWRALAMGPFLIVIVAGLFLPESTNHVFDALIVIVAISVLLFMIYSLSQITRDLFYRCPRCHWRFGLGQVCSSCSLPRNRPTGGFVTLGDPAHPLFTMDDQTKH